MTLESAFTQQALDEYGHLPIERRTRNGLVFRQGASRIAYLSNYPLHHKVNGIVRPITTDWEIGTSGELGVPGLSPRITDDGELQFIGQSFRHKTVGVGLIKLNPLEVVIGTTFLSGYRSGNKFIRDRGIFSHQLTLHERNRVKEELLIQEKPPSLDGDYFVIVSKIFDADFPTDQQIPDGLVYGDAFVFTNGFAYDADGKRHPVTQYVRTVGSNKYLLSGVPTAWLDTATYPVVIDPVFTSQPDPTAGKDSWISSDLSTTNFGTSTNLQIRSDSPSPDEFTSIFIQFDLTTIPAGSIINTATLSMFQYGTNYFTGFPMYARRVRRDWTETGITHVKYDGTNNWGTAGCLNTTTDVDSVNSASLTITNVVEWKDWDLDTTYTEQMLPAGSWSNYGWKLYISTAPGGAEFYYYYSSDYTVTPSLRPKLVLDYIPPPAGVLPIFFTQEDVCPQLLILCWTC